MGPEVESGEAHQHRADAHGGVSVYPPADVDEQNDQQRADEKDKQGICVYHHSGHRIALDEPSSLYHSQSVHVRNDQEGYGHDRIYYGDLEFVFHLHSFPVHVFSPSLVRASKVKGEILGGGWDESVRHGTVGKFHSRSSTGLGEW
ncbi:hypothetical protein AKJ51_03740 [candidate division MSBL1 archaeon SCGC-AAA382A20]|uniref:Uncharacterized protein n=1 Tax=candidate division MSBL1 archaeon SCGC-AAA382A20 TaxID=1698280 RepID=A0A133VIX0_9EURY|nr:hypothetical protein AKJ51_03740 [candidate division MSBL1 archaeon SCGC-AAA382A20]